MRRLIIILILLGCTSCYAPYSFRIKPIESGTNQVLQIMQLTSKYPYVVIHDNINSWKFSNYQLIDSNTAITGILSGLPPSRNTFTVVDENRVNRARREFDKPFDEMHIWVNFKSLKSGDKVTIYQSDIERVQVYQPINAGGKSLVGISIVLGICAIVTGLLILNTLY